MNHEEKIKVIELGNQGLTIREISQITGIPTTTVNRWKNEGNKVVVCPVCRKKFLSRKGFKGKKFCSDKCRYTWWNSHRSLMKHRSSVQTKCPHCGELFIARRKGQLFCCRNCYLSEVTKR